MAKADVFLDEIDFFFAIDAPPALEANGVEIIADNGFFLHRTSG
jgi:hypothetical protein